VTGPALLAVDGGGSKVDAALLTKDGAVLGAARVPASFDTPGDPAFLTQIGNAVGAAVADAGIDTDGRPVSELGVLCLSGADLPADDRRISRGIAGEGWTSRHVLRNDTFAVLRAGTDRDWGVGVVCGSGTNCTGVAPDGRIFRFPAMGDISGDWGGGYELGSVALWHAIRSADGRGDRTSLEQRVPTRFGLRRPRQVTEALHAGRLDRSDLRDLAPVLFEAATQDGDAVARSLVDRQADEIVLMVRTAVRRLRLTSLDPDVVLGGGIMRAADPRFHARIADGIADVCPRASVRNLASPPVIGAAMLGLDLLGGSRAAHARARASLTHERLTTDTAVQRKER
jgi:N-acetylglucosamine kinase-like BadF-type ATPase